MVCSCSRQRRSHFLPILPPSLLQLHNQMAASAENPRRICQNGCSGLILRSSKIKQTHFPKNKGNTMPKKKQELDAETMAVIEWCIEVEGCLVAAGATQAQAQEYIEDQIELLTDQFYDQLSPEEAAQQALA
jgi:hypothetical protein